jgi:hypothetical protein
LSIVSANDLANGLVQLAEMEPLTVLILLGAVA